MPCEQLSMGGGGGGGGGGGFSNGVQDPGLAIRVVFREIKEVWGTRVKNWEMDGGDDGDEDDDSLEQ